MSTPLQGQVALVTGASSGIGRAIALALAAHGVRICATGRREDELRQVGQGIYPADLAAEGEAERVAADVLRDEGGVDILVHAAGVLHTGPLANADLRELDDQYALNLRAPYALTRALLPSLQARAGQVVFVNSTAGRIARANVGAYAATKHGLAALADSLREEANPAGVRVLSLFVGRTATPMQEALHAAEGRAWKPELLVQPEDVAAVAVHALTLPRTVEVTDISLRPLTKSY